MVVALVTAEAGSDLDGEKKSYIYCLGRAWTVAENHVF
jgi:hypothetical protein